MAPEHVGWGSGTMDLADRPNLLRAVLGAPTIATKQGTHVVIEANLDDAVSYTKGCYVGQEIIIRIKHRGHVAKKLTGLKFDKPVESGATITADDGKEIGRVTSATYSPKLESPIALGYVRYEYLNPGTPVKAGDISGTVAELPFVRGSWYD